MRAAQTEHLCLVLTPPLLPANVDHYMLYCVCCRLLLVSHSFSCLLCITLHHQPCSNLCFRLLQASFNSVRILNRMLPHLTILPSLCMCTCPACVTHETVCRHARCYKYDSEPHTCVKNQQPSYFFVATLPTTEHSEKKSINSAVNTEAQRGLPPANRRQSRQSH